MCIGNMSKAREKKESDCVMSDQGTKSMTLALSRA